MVAHLIRDFIRRSGRPYVWAITLLTLLWGVIESTGRTAAAGDNPFSLSLAFLFGPLFAMGSFTAREFTMRPVSRREIWRAQWLLGTVFVATCTTLARLQGSLLAHASELERVVSPGTLAGAWLVDFAYCGACFGLVAVVARSPRLSALIRRLLVTHMPVALIAAFLIGGGIAMGFLVRALLPSNWHDDLWGVPGLVVALGLMLTAIGFLHRPAIAARSAPGRLRTGDDVRSIRAHAGRDKTRRLSALPLVMWRQTRAAALLGVGAVTSMFALAAALPSHRGLAALTDTFAHGMFGDALASGGWWPKPAWLVLCGLGAASTIVPLLAHLRVLPVSRRTLNLLLLAGGLPYWLAITATFVTIHLLMARTLPRVDLDSMILAAGLSAPFLASSSRTALWFPGIMPVGLAGLVAFLRIILLPRLGLLLGVQWPLGILFFVLAAFWNHRALTRRAPRHEFFSTFAWAERA
jgi:hypothetical protein